MEIRSDEDYAQVAYDYAQDIVNGRILSNYWVKLACKQWIDDLERIGQDDYPYTLDIEKAGSACAFIESLPLPKVKKSRENKNFVLEPWQVFVVVTLYGWVSKETGFRRYREFYLKVPRKNGKTALAAAIAIYEAFANGIDGSEVYFGARDEAQAKIGWNAAKQILRKARKLRETLGIELRAEVHYCEETDSTIGTLVGKPEDGQNPQLYVCDEYHQHRTDEQYQTMQTGMGERDEPLILVITTAGKAGDGPCFQYEMEKREILEGLKEEPETFVLIYQCDKDDDIYSDKALQKANPNIGITVQWDFLRQMARQAKNTPRRRAFYKSKHLDIWAGDEDGALSVEDWLASAAEYLTPEDPTLIEAFIEPFRDRPVWLGLDLAPKRDFCALVILAERNQGGFDVATRFWLPSKTFEDYSETSGLHEWAEKGWIQKTEGSLVDFKSVEDDVWIVWQRLNAQILAFDPAHAYSVVSNLEQRGVEVGEFPQTAAMMNQPINLLQAYIEDGKIRHDDNPCMSWQIGNLHADFNKELQRPSKIRAEDKIDGVVALLEAIAAHELAPPEPEWSFKRVA